MSYFLYSSLVVTQLTENENKVDIIDTFLYLYAHVISSLDMASNDYQTNSLEEQISQCESHWYIKLEKQNLDDNHMNIIIQEAIINKQCVGLWLSYNNITSIGVRILVNTLNDNKTLQYLYLSNNHIGDDGVQLLAYILKTNNSTLKDLDIGNNNITNAGVRYIAEMLRENKNLIQLNLSENQINDQSIQLLSNAFGEHQNQTLEKLYLNSNRLITNVSTIHLVEMIGSKRKLNTLWIQNCNLSDHS